MDLPLHLSFKVKLRPYATIGVLEWDSAAIGVPEWGSAQSLGESDSRGRKFPEERQPGLTV